MLAFPDFSKRGKLRKCVIILEVVCYTSQLPVVPCHCIACVCVLLPVVPCHCIACVCVVAGSSMPLHCVCVCVVAGSSMPLHCVCACVCCYLMINSLKGHRLHNGLSDSSFHYSLCTYNFSKNHLSMLHVHRYINGKPVLFCLSVSVKWLAVKTASEMTYIVSSGALSSTPTTNQGKRAVLVPYIIIPNTHILTIGRTVRNEYQPL